jgi:hypothetical protein
MDTAVGVPVMAVANGVPVVAVANGKLTGGRAARGSRRIRSLFVFVVPGGRTGGGRTGRVLG